MILGEANPALENSLLQKVQHLVGRSKAVCDRLTGAKSDRLRYAARLVGELIMYEQVSPGLARARCGADDWASTEAFSTGLKGRDSMLRSAWAHVGAKHVPAADEGWFVAVWCTVSAPVVSGSTRALPLAAAKGWLVAELDRNVEGWGRARQWVPGQHVEARRGLDDAAGLWLADLPGYVLALVPAEVMA